MAQHGASFYSAAVLIATASISHGVFLQQLEKEEEHNLSRHTPEQGMMMEQRKPWRIPHILHQSWKNSSLPEATKNSINVWREAMPDWPRSFYTDEDNRLLWKGVAPTCLPLYEFWPENISRADAARILYMRQWGGVYADLDVTPCGSFDALSLKYDLVLVRSPKGFISNFFMASAAGHPFWDYALEKLCRNETHELKNPSNGGQAVMWVAGPRFLDEAWTEWSAEEVKAKRKSMLKRAKVYDFQDFQEEVARHDWSGTWHCREGGVENCTEDDKYSFKPTHGQEKGVDDSRTCRKPLQ